MIRILRTVTAFRTFCSEVFGGGSRRPPRSDKYPRRPRRIFAVYPEEGSTASPVPEIGAGFFVHGVMDEGALLLALDDEDVTAETWVLSPMDHPQSHGTLLYRPKSPLSPGRHKASVSFPDAVDGRCRYVWYFEVSPDHRGNADDRSPAPWEVPPPSRVARTTSDGINTAFDERGLTEVEKPGNE